MRGLQEEGAPSVGSQLVHKSLGMRNEKETLGLSGRRS